VVLAASAFASSACGSSSSSGAAGSGKGALEQTTLRIGIPKGEIGALPIYTGVDKGFFKSAGIDVQVNDTFTSYQEALQALSDGKVDLVYDDYAHAILEQSTGAYRLQLVAEGYTAGDGSVQLLSKHTTVPTAQLVQNIYSAKNGFLVPTAGTNDPATDYTVPTVMLMSSLTDLANSFNIAQNNAKDHLKMLPAGVISEKFTSSNDPNMAGVIPEPFFSDAATTYQMTRLMDLTHGATQAMPMGGYFAKQDFAVDDTNLFAAFTGALNQAKALATQRTVAMGEMQAHYGTMFSSAVAATISFGTFPTTVNVDRVNRVLTVMQAQGLAPFYNIDTMMPPDAIRGGS